MRKGLHTCWASSFMVLLIFFSSRTHTAIGKSPITCCWFDLETLILSAHCGEKIRHIDAFTVMENNNSSKLFSFRKTYDPSVWKTVISIPDDSLVRQKEILIKIWTNDYVIDDYRIKIKPGDWGTKKTLYGVYNSC